jgi:signal transduction histidine kinase
MSRIGRLDLAVGGLLAALLAWEVLFSDVEGPTAAMLAAAIVAGLALVLRRAATLPAIAVSMAASIALDELAEGDYEPQAIIVAMLVAAYAAGAHLPRRAGYAGLALVIAAIVVIEAGDVVVLGPVCAGAYGAGRLWRARERDAVRLAELAEALERERVEESRIAIAEERARIARELHDVVSHAMTTIVIEAGAERLHLAPGSERTSRTLSGIERTGREALGEMRRLLGVLREHDEEPALAPQPSLDHLAELVEHVGRAGLDVALRVEGRPVALSPGLDVNAYRIVQEALTNVLKHAGATRATVVIVYDTDVLGLTVTDDGRSAQPPADGPGHGLTGLRERVTLYGGELEAGPDPDGGFTLHARLPLHGA